MTDWYHDWSKRLPEPKSPGEKADSRREYYREYRARNREKLRAYHAEYYRANRRKPKPLHDYKDCIACGAPFYPFHFSDKYCSAKCRRESYRGNLR